MLLVWCHLSQQQTNSAASSLILQFWVLIWALILVQYIRVVAGPEPNYECDLQSEKYGVLTTCQTTNTFFLSLVFFSFFFQFGNKAVAQVACEVFQLLISHWEPLQNVEPTLPKKIIEVIFTSTSVESLVVECNCPQPPICGPFGNLYISLFITFQRAIYVGWIEICDITESRLELWALLGNQICGGNVHDTISRPVHCLLWFASWRCKHGLNV